MRRQSSGKMWISKILTSTTNLPEPSPKKWISFAWLFVTKKKLQTSPLWWCWWSLCGVTSSLHEVPISNAVSIMSDPCSFSEILKKAKGPNFTLRCVDRTSSFQKENKLITAKYHQTWTSWSTGSLHSNVCGNKKETKNVPAGRLEAERPVRKAWGLDRDISSSMPVGCQRSCQNHPFQEASGYRNYPKVSLEENTEDDLKRHPKHVQHETDL